MTPAKCFWWSRVCTGTAAPGELYCEACEKARQECIRKGEEEAAGKRKAGVVR